MSLNPEFDAVVPKVVKLAENFASSAAQNNVKSIVWTSSSLAALLPQPNKENIVVTAGMHSLHK
jgi:cytochrome c2